MTWSENIQFRRRPADVRRFVEAPPQNWDDLLLQREKAAYQRGRLDAEHSLSEQLVRQRNEIATAQRGILDSLKRSIPQVIHETEDAVLHLALEAAQKVVAGLPVSPELIEAVVREALARLQGNAEVIVQLHPEDLELLRRNDSALLKNDAAAPPVRFVPAPDLARGDCLVQTRFGVIDACRETKFEQIQKCLTP